MSGQNGMSLDISCHRCEISYKKTCRCNGVIQNLKSKMSTEVHSWFCEHKCYNKTNTGHAIQLKASGIADLMRRYHTDVHTRGLSCPDVLLVQLSHRWTQRCEWRGHDKEKSKGDEGWAPTATAAISSLYPCVSLHVLLIATQNWTERWSSCMSATLVDLQYFFFNMVTHLNSLSCCIKRWTLYVCVCVCV